MTQYFLAFSKDKENGNSKMSQHIPDRPPPPPPPPQKEQGNLANFFKLTPPKKLLPDYLLPHRPIPSLSPGWPNVSEEYFQEKKNQKVIGY